MKKVIIIMSAISLVFCIGVAVTFFLHKHQESNIPLNSTRDVTADIHINNEGKLNINTATDKEFQSLNGIGEVLAKRIVAYREENGPFSKTEDLLNVYGIGKTKLNNILPYIYVE